MILFSQDIRLNFRIYKCAMLTMKRGKHVSSESKDKADLSELFIRKVSEKKRFITTSSVMSS